MSTKQNAKFQELVAKLREIFQIDRPELDFGIYRILNARAGEINDYLENRLAEKVQAALAAGNTASAQQLQAELQEAEKNAHALGVSPDGVPKVQELRAKLKEATTGASEHENAVFSHLLAFFSRYYDNGDFISQRRYKGDTYAIPYAGEEVMLYWANKDQYYTKSGENFANYSFKLEDGRTVHFRLVAADTAKDNRKDNDKERRFALIEKKTVTRIDEQGDEYEEELLPVEEVDSASGKELIVRFEYKPVAKGTKQDALAETAVQTVLAADVVKASWLDLGKRAPTEKNPQRTVLEKHLSDYTTKNTADYFIHKDLGSFLRRELDFYIKNEVMHLDDVQNAGAFSDIEKNLRMIQCLRTIALELIAFLAQLEDFQKKLWLKRKFVVSSHYCITLDRVSEALYPEIAENQKQWRQWMNLGVWTSDKPGTIEDLKRCRFMMIDTSLFEIGFKHRLQATIDNIDASLGGVVIHGDNFQALNLAKERYRASIDFVYIDPPYNTVHSKIAYKNQFEHSSWLALISNTLPFSRYLFGDLYSFGFAIDDYEYNNAFACLRDHFSDCDVSTIVINHHPQGSGGRISRTHEYYIVASPINGPQYLGLPKEDETEDRSFMRSGTAENNYRTGRWRSFYALLVDPTTKKVVGTEPPPQLGESYPLGPTDDGLERIYPINASQEERVWRSSYETGKKRVANGEIVLTDRGSVKQLIDHQDKRETLFSNWVGADYNAGTNGTAVLDNLGLGGVFDYPKSVRTLEQAFWMQSFGKSNFTVLDYFAGSGTTAHATLSLNRKDGAQRSYVLVEQGDYFETVLKPRLQKIVFSAEWANGKPTAPETGISHCFKVLKLESYEDALNNLQLRRPVGQDDLFATLPQEAKDDYLLRYMLDVESRGSLLSVEDFKKPFEYGMNIAVDSAGAYAPRRVDLVETFNYLIGLTVQHIDAQPERGFVTVTGTLPSGETCLVLWRDSEMLDYEGISKLCDKLAINPADNEFDVVYINGDHNIPTVLTQTQEEGGATRVLKLRQIEPEFLSRMFSVEDI
ncbi:DNA methylase family protein [Burkholderia pseudomallei]|nr:DNA methyltransferase [Burkholderia pseudomallei]KGS91804.1 DNA methylase family protein [Burkholderia pseudomallei MSHR7498]KGU72904.1 DNA methylase family protein [Burkholderia pseudomallei MSHR4304]KGV29780.1 DNA methylase family protein [Burkholderia pseudomallei MSHR4308]KGX21027.1 DNA methylase family protein [Burkholderia pseudomallei]KGX28365.1 DNA methylase family protein [Burkholderia pseudomallei]